jgi:Ser/Thr protein kinase RdoA (MazF antagonist)
LSAPRRPATADEAVPEAVARAFPALDGGFELLDGSTGLLHRTLHLRSRDGRAYVLQRVSDVFAPEIHENIARVSAHLRARGIPSLELVPTRQGGLFLDLGAQGRWRLLVRIEGVSFDRAQSSAQIESAAEAVGQFHRALDDFDAPLAPMGIPFRDTALYRERLAAALSAHCDPVEREAVARLRDALDAAFAVLGAPMKTPPRVIHGDLKISNVIFASPEPPGRDRAVALIDLDTLMRAPLWCEWGDAWRSWCNVRDEDALDARFDLEVFAASLRGFRRGYGRSISAAERASLVDATERIALELSVRYATDALERRYFAWNPDRFPTAHAHNLRRARGQLALYEAARAVRDRRAETIEARLS